MATESVATIGGRPLVSISSILSIQFPIILLIPSFCMSAPLHNQVFNARDNKVVQNNPLVFNGINKDYPSYPHPGLSSSTFELTNEIPIGETEDSYDKQNDQVTRKKRELPEETSQLPEKTSQLSEEASPLPEKTTPSESRQENNEMGSVAIADSRKNSNQSSQTFVWNGTQLQSSHNTEDHENKSLSAQAAAEDSRNATANAYAEKDGEADSIAVSLDAGHASAFAQSKDGGSNAVSLADEGNSKTTAVQGFENPVSVLEKSIKTFKNSAGEDKETNNLEVEDNQIATMDDLLRANLKKSDISTMINGIVNHIPLVIIPQTQPKKPLVMTLELHEKTNLLPELLGNMLKTGDEGALVSSNPLREAKYDLTSEPEDLSRNQVVQQKIFLNEPRPIPKDTELDEGRELSDFSDSLPALKLRKKRSKEDSMEDIGLSQNAVVTGDKNAKKKSAPPATKEPGKDKKAETPTKGSKPAGKDAAGPGKSSETGKSATGSKPNQQAGKSVGSEGTGDAPKKKKRKKKGKGSNATSRAKTGKATATAMSKDGDSRATALNGTTALAMAISGHGDAESVADTYGDGGAKASSLTKGEGDSRSVAKSRGNGTASSMALASGTGLAQSDAEAVNGGNSSSKALSRGSGSTQSNSMAAKGSSDATAISKGKGDASSNSFSEGEDGSSKSLASSQGGNAVSNSKAAKGDSHAIAETKGEGGANANSLANNGYSRADAVAEEGDSTATAMNGSDEELEGDELDDEDDGKEQRK